MNKRLHNITKFLVRKARTLTSNRLRTLVSALLFILAIPIGLWFLLHDTEYTFAQLKYHWGFWLSWLFSTLIAFAVMTLGEYATRLLDRHVPWHGNRSKRLGIQLGVGVALPLAVAVAWNAGIFTGREATANLDPYFGSEFWLTALLLLVFNALCCVALVLWRHLQGLVARAGQAVEQARELKRQADEKLAMRITAARTPAKRRRQASGELDTEHLLAHAAYIEVANHACQVFRSDGGKEVVVGSMDQLEADLAGTDIRRIHRKHMVHRQAIAKLELDRANHRNFVRLAEPYQDVKLRIGETYLDDVITGQGGG